MCTAPRSVCVLSILYFRISNALVARYDTDAQALVVTYTNNEVSRQAVERLHLAFPKTPIFARATDYEQYLALEEVGANAVVSDLR